MRVVRAKSGSSDLSHSVLSLGTTAKNVSQTIKVADNWVFFASRSSSSGSGGGVHF